MKGSEDLYAREILTEQPRSGAHDSEHARERTLNRIKYALVTTDVTLEVHQDSGGRLHGFDPYDSLMGRPASTRDPWARRVRR